MPRRIKKHKENEEKKGQNLTEIIKRWDTLNKFLPLNLPLIFKESLNKDRSPIIQIENPESGWYLHGPAGIGKSFQAACIMNEIAKRKKMRGGSFWVNVPKLLNDIKMGFGKKENEDLIEKYSKVTLLCLDDLGTEQNTQWVMQTLYLIVNYRYENMKTTIITSNLNLSELANKMEDDRLASRIKGMCKIYKLDGNDRRNLK